MKVLFMITRDWANPASSGGDIQPWEYARYLAAVGHAVTFLTSSFRGAAREERIQGIRVVRLGGVKSLWIRTFLYYIRHCRGKYDLVVEEGFGGSRIPRFAPLYVEVPIVTEWHQVHAALFASQYPKALVPALNLLEKVTAYVHRNTSVRAGTKEWKEAFPSIGFKAENVFVVPVSLDEAWIDTMEPGEVLAPTILWLGKFRRYKCPHHVVLSMPRILKMVPGAKLILAGRHDDQKYEAWLHRMVREEGLTDNVEFRFNVTEDEKKGLLRQARVLALPSSVEGFGIVTLEANSCGVPVVASDGVPKGAVRHNDNGLRYSFGEIEQLSRSIIEILTNLDLYNNLSANSKAFARQFAWSKVGAQFENVLKGVLATRDKKAYRD